ncbi:phosphotransferase enzyme family protein [Phytohabitans suffuscus]|uniref:phosphotransferase enzyme family protein n=1 Tax=Phytohabitans suffuscus TaxID=624315 RepID=UPI001565DAA0|nr:phosphotransferase [Phytohabitans suffuscus]
MTHSLLHAEDLAQLVEREYAIAAPVRVSLLNRGFNDTYLVTDVEGGRRALRVYNREKYWIRSESDLRFELDLLEHLAAAGLEMDAFQTSHDRYHLDERILVERPLASLAPYCGSGRAALDLAELRKLGERLTGEIQRLRTIGGAYGIIHADLHRGNTNIDGDGRFVTFDFDHCGFGLRAYDLVTLYRGADSPKQERERWAAVLAGYQQVRPLSPAEVAGFPVLAACRAMWDIGDWLGAAGRTGDAWVTEAAIARLLADVRKAEPDPAPRLAGEAALER